MIVLAAIAGVLGLAACGSSSKNNNGGETIAIAINPTTATLYELQTQAFVAAVTGSSNTKATWSVQEGSTGGTISSGGVYTAPVTPGTYHVVATSAADNTKTAIATVTVNAISVTISPTTAALAVTQTQTFTATVTGSSNVAVSWSVSEGPAGGSINAGGVYIAPSSPGTYHVVATSKLDGTTSATATVTVSNVTVAISPTTAALITTQTQTFTATVTGTTNPGVSWSVLEGSSGGTITSAGLYTAPRTAGTYHVQATSSVDYLAQASATVTVSAAPAPTFTSTAPTTAQEGVEYTYTPAATDPAGGTVTFTLGAVPSGATLTSGVLSWTPTHLQSRVNNNFTINAATSEGGKATQTFSVTPNGNLNVTVSNTWITSSGPSSVAQDLSAETMKLYVTGGSVITGTGTNGGTYTFTNVPAGYLWLEWTSHQPMLRLWTGSSDLDLGSAFLGRSTAEPAVSGVTVTLAAQGIAAPTSKELFEWYSADVDSLNLLTGGSMNSSSLFTDTFVDMNNLLNQPSGSGDNLYINRLSSVAVTGSSLSAGALIESYGPDSSVQEVDGGTLTLPAPPTTALTMTVPSTTGSATLYARASQFNTFLSRTTNNAASSTSRFAVQAMPYSATQGVVGSVPDLLIYPFDGTLQTTDLKLGSVTYYNPFVSSYTPFVAYTQQSTVNYPVPGNPAQNVPLTTQVTTQTTTFPSSTSSLAPLTSPVTTPQVDGGTFFQSATLASDTPTISWSPPSTASPYGYELVVYAFETGANPALVPVLDAYVKAVNSVQIPPGILGSGKTYVFSVYALKNQNGPGLETAPLRKALPYGLANSLSGEFTAP